MTIHELQQATVVGPERSGNTVIVDSKSIPNMHCFDRGNTIEFILDNRFSFTFPKEIAHDAAV